MTDRRETVAAALSLPSHSLTHDECLFLADAAIPAALPDRSAFRAKLGDVVASRLRWEHDPCELWKYQYEQRCHDLEVLVFGEEDDIASLAARVLYAGPPIDPTP